MEHRENLKSFTLCSLPTELLAADSWLLAFMEFLLTVPEPFSHKLGSSFPLFKLKLPEAPQKRDLRFAPTSLQGIFEM